MSQNVLEFRWASSLINQYFATKEKAFAKALTLFSEPVQPKMEPWLSPEHHDILKQIIAHTQKNTPVSSALINLSEEAQNYVLCQLASTLKRTVCVVESQAAPDDRSELDTFVCKLFAEAENHDWILFFDEADALFGKRGEVKDAHDRFANDESGTLIKRLSVFKGLALFNFFDPRNASSLASVFTFVVLNRRAVT